MIRTLIIEFDPMVRKIHEDSLQQYSEFVLIDGVSSIDEAKRVIEKKEIDLIIMELVFSESSGIDFLKWLRKYDYDCHTIIVTGNTDPKLIKEASRFGIIDYILKPFDCKRMKNSLQRYILFDELDKEKEQLEQTELNKFFFYECTDKQLAEEGSNEFSKQTYEKVLNFLANYLNKSFTSQEVANQIGVSRITARRYLELLEKAGIIEMELEYGGVGRPKNKYRYIAR